MFDAEPGTAPPWGAGVCRRGSSPSKGGVSTRRENAGLEALFALDVLSRAELLAGLKLADMLYVMENGRVVFAGSQEELDSSEDVKQRNLGVGVDRRVSRR